MQTPNQGSEHKQSLVERVQSRRDELKRNLTASEVTASTRRDIEAALAAVGTLLTGDLDKLPNTVKGDLSRWLETNRHLGVSAGSPTVAPTPPKADAKPDAPAGKGPAPTKPEEAVVPGAPATSSN